MQITHMQNVNFDQVWDNISQLALLLHKNISAKSSDLLWFLPFQVKNICKNLSLKTSEVGYKSIKSCCTCFLQMLKYSSSIKPHDSYQQDLL